MRIIKNWPTKVVLCSNTTQCQVQSETPGAWMGSFDASTISSGPGTKQLPSFSCMAKLIKLALR